jgi:ABC-type glycerol-3-phosphate transport system permease component
MKFFGHKKPQLAGRSRLASSIIFIFMFLLSSLMVAPLIYSIINSLKPIDELFAFPPRFFVLRPSLENYTILFKLVSNMWVPFSRYLFNSVFVTIVVTTGNVLIASMAAYPLAKYKLRLGFLFDIVVLTLLFNATVLALPQYVIMSKLNMINTVFVYIVPNISMPISLFLMKQFMERVPIALIESAHIDGANQLQIFFKIVMPQVKPAWMTLTLFTFQAVWAQQPLNMVFDENLKLINMAFTNIIAAGISLTGAAMAAAVVLMLPPIVVFIVTQSNVIETMSASGIKE